MIINFQKWIYKGMSSFFSLRFKKLSTRAAKHTTSLKDSSLDSFTASNSWLEKWKAAHGIREMRITGEANNVSIPTVKSWIERIPELVKGAGP